MLSFKRRKIAFVQLGNLLKTLLNEATEQQVINQEFKTVLHQAKAENSWFIEDNIRFSLNQWANVLDENHLTAWTDQYDLYQVHKSKTIGVVMAGNIPLVGFHDFLCILLAGHSANIKLSSADKRLLPFIAKLLIDIEPEFETHISFEQSTLKNFDAVIATGSNNTSRYFEYYFRSKPHIIRKNRNAVCVLSGNETPAEYMALAEDIFRYFGLGCRNVSKIFIPKDFNFRVFFEAISYYEHYMNNHKYANNYDYNKAVYLMSDINFKDNGFLILKEDSAIPTPIGVLNYEVYEDEININNSLKNNTENIQCIVGNHHLCNVGFGQSQHPNLDDYADGVDTMKFLTELHTTIKI